jgi:hypothetical protein
MGRNNRSMALDEFTTPANTPKKCILTGVELTEETDSKAHIIPSALGGRLKPKGILSRTANTEIDDKTDDELIKAYYPFMVLVNGSRDQSGGLAPIRASDETGKPVKIGTDQIEFGQPEYIEQILPDGTKNYAIKARTHKEMRTLLGRLKKDIPDFDIEAMMENARVEQQPAGRLNFPMQFGPRSTFPAVFVMASVFSAYNGLLPHPEFVTYVETFNVDARPLPPDTFYFLKAPKWLSNPAKVGHSIVFFCDAERQKALFYAELFNQPGIAVVLPYGGSDDRCFSYGVDVMEGIEAAVDVDVLLLKSFDWKATHLNGDPGLWKEVEKCSTPLVAIAHQRSFEAAKNEILFKHFSSNPGAIITEADVRNASRELAELVMRCWRPPTGS